MAKFNDISVCKIASKNIDVSYLWSKNFSIQDKTQICNICYCNWVIYKKNTTYLKIFLSLKKAFIAFFQTFQVFFDKSDVI